MEFFEFTFRSDDITGTPVARLTGEQIRALADEAELAAIFRGGDADYVARAVQGAIWQAVIEALGGTYQRICLQTSGTRWCADVLSGAASSADTWTNAVFYGHHAQGWLTVRGYGD